MERSASASLGVLGLTAFLLAAAPASADCPPDVGAAFAAACPCVGPNPAQPDVPWKNHGQYVKCVAHFRNGLRHDGCLTAETQRTIQRCAARSTCGKPDRVLCCSVKSTGTCGGDPIPGDGTAAGTCDNTGASCDVNADCTVVKGPKVARNEPACTARGGYSAGTGSVCAGCPAPPAP